MLLLSIVLTTVRMLFLWSSSNSSVDSSTSTTTDVGRFPSHKKINLDLHDVTDEKQLQHDKPKHHHHQQQKQKSIGWNIHPPKIQNLVLEKQRDSIRTTNSNNHRNILIDGTIENRGLNGGRPQGDNKHNQNLLGEPESSIASSSSFSSSFSIMPNVSSSDLQFLLDYVVVGFPKCGTTTLLKWLMKHKQTRSFEKELHELNRDNPAMLVMRLYHNLLKNNKRNNTKHKNELEKKHYEYYHPPTKNRSSNSNTTISVSNIPIFQGFKNPDTLYYNTAIQHLQQYWPETKLLLSVRHPLHWFMSLYNFRIEIGHFNKLGVKYLPKKPGELLSLSSVDFTRLIGNTCYQNNEDDNNKSNNLMDQRKQQKQEIFVCTHMSAFHTHIAKLGKTSRTTSEEQRLLSFPKDDKDNSFWQNAPTNSQSKIFFTLLEQLGDENERRSQVFRQDLQDFLGLSLDLPPILKIRPLKKVRQNYKKVLLREKKERLQELANNNDTTTSSSIANMFDTEKYRISSIEQFCTLPNLQNIRNELLQIAKHSSLWLRNYFLKSPDVIVSSRTFVEETLMTWMQDPCKPFHNKNNNNANVQQSVTTAATDTASTWQKFGG